MKVYNEEKTEILEYYDLEKGTLENELYNNEIILVYKLFNKERLNEIKRLEIQGKIYDLQNWFDTYYAQHEQKYRRLMTLGLLDNDGIDPKNKILDLYNEAEAKRKRIQELENALSEQ